MDPTQPAAAVTPAAPAVDPTVVAAPDPIVAATVPPEPPPMPSVFVLGPCLDNVIEPEPTTVPAAVTAPGRRQISFDTPPTTPGGIVNMLLLPPLAPTDVLPINVYAFFVQPAATVPAQADRTPDWFFKNGTTHGFLAISPATVDPTTGKFAVTAAGVTPSLQPYFVQTILEFSA